MSDILNIGVNALLANRTALDVAGHNIANVNTPGYSRQRLELTSAAGAGTSTGFAGNGVQIRNVQRLTDQFVFAREIDNSASYARVNTFNAEAQRADTLLSDTATGLGTPLNSFFDSVATLASNPSLSAARTAVIGSAQALATRFKDLQGEFDASERDISSRITQTVDEINGYASSIAQINNRISLALGSSSQPPNDLIDQRDQLVRDLSARVGVTTVAQDDGSLNVFVANGQSLVVGTRASALGVAGNEFDSARLEVTAGKAANAPVISGQLGGGSLGGLLDARRQLLDPAREKLGRIAVAVSEAINAQQAKGVDQAGNAGGPLFQPLAGVAAPSSRNSGSATVAVGFADASQLDGSEYLLGFDGSAWTLKNTSTGANVAFSGSGTPADPLLAGGLKLVVSGTAVAGDRYSIQPARSAAGQLSVAIADPARIAAAAPIRAAAAVGNSGSGAISSGEVLDASNPALRNATRIQFTSASTYSVNGAGSFTYTPGSAISLNGWQVQISGSPANGDRFDITATGPNSGDNRNAQLLAGIASKALLDGGLSTIGNAHGALVEQVGSLAQQTGLQVQAQSALQSQSTAERNALAGVSLDEEAADLVRYQQAYQAAAQVVSVASNVFDALLAATRR